MRKPGRVVTVQYNHPCNNYGQVAYWAEQFDTFEFIRLSENRYLLSFKNRTDRQAFKMECSNRFEGYRDRDDFDLLIWF
jgi:hypothetical protein